MYLAAICLVNLIASVASATPPPPPFEKVDRSRSDFAFLNVQGVAPERSEKLQADLAPGAAHSWNVHLNLDALTRIEGQGGVYANTRRGIPLSGHHLDLEVPQRPVSLRLQLDTLYQGFDGVTTYAGVIDGDDGSLVAISVDGEQVLGKIHHSEGYTYLIQRNYQGQGHTMSIVDQSLIPRAHKLDNDQVEKGHIDISPSTDTGAPAEAETIRLCPPAERCGFWSCIHRQQPHGMISTLWRTISSAPSIRA